MSDPTFEVVTTRKQDKSWEAGINGISELRRVGATSNESLAALRVMFDEWYDSQRKNASPRAGSELGAIWQKVFFSLHRHYESEPKSAPGDFGVDSTCCTSCGVPQMVAPDLVGWTEEPFVSCYWKKQPETPAEFERAFKIFDGQELGCHRYSGHDPAIQKRVGYDQCDNAPRTDPFTSEHWGKRTTPEPDPSKSASLWSRIIHRIRS